MNAPMLNHPAIHHPGAARAPDAERRPIFDESWGSVVHQRIAVRLDEADEERLAHEAGDAEHRPSMRARFGHVLIAVGMVVAGAAIDRGATGRPI